MRPRLLFVYLQQSSFVREDLRLLSEDYELVPFHFGSDKKLGAKAFAGTLLAQLSWLLRELPRAEAVYGWFADYHMVLPVLIGRMLRKPAIVSVGGFDAVSLPSVGHGVMTSTWRAPLARLVLQRADVLLPVSASLVHSRNRFSDWPAETEQGILAWTRKVRGSVRVLPTGYDPGEWPMGPMRRGAVVVTVGHIDSDRTFHIKGIDLFLAAARRIPDVQFRIIGVAEPDAFRDRYGPPSNVELIRPVPRAELVAHYHAASVYAQLSRAEGLPNVLCEAMLCGCIPVGSRVFGIPDGIGDAGLVVDDPQPKTIETALRSALNASPDRRRSAREHIMNQFSLETRRRRLVQIIQEAATPDLHA